MSQPRLSLGHVGVFATDVERMKRFYTEVLGLTVTDDGRTSRGTRIVFTSGNPAEHHQVVLVEGRAADSPGTIQQLSFRVDSLSELRAGYERVRSGGAGDIAPIDHGNSWSVYFRDPEGNRLEIYMATPWHVAQPHAEPLDLALSDEALFRACEAKCRKDPTFRAVEDWRADFARERETVPA